MKRPGAKAAVAKELEILKTAVWDEKKVKTSSPPSRVPERGHVKDEQGYEAVFAKQGASGSYVAAATFVDTISKLLDQRYGWRRLV